MYTYAFRMVEHHYTCYYDVQCDTCDVTSNEMFYMSGKLSLFTIGEQSADSYIPLIRQLHCIENKHKPDPEHKYCIDYKCSESSNFAHKLSVTHILKESI